MKIAWVAPKPDLREGPDGVFSELASIRYRALIPARALAARGHSAAVVGLDKENFDRLREQIADSDCVVLCKNYFASEDSERMLEALQARGVKTLFDVSDDRFLGKPGPHLQRMVAQAGAVVAASPMLQEIIKRHTGRDSFVVGDPFEGVRGEARWSPAGPRLKALWFGHGSNLESLQSAFASLLQAGKKNPIDLRIVTRDIDHIERDCKEFNRKHRQALSLRYAVWSIGETASSLADTDFVVIPARPGEQWTLAKSTNRIIESLWAGRFVVAHPIPSYMEFKPWAWIGDDMAEGIAWMVDNGALLTDRIRAAQDHIAAVYSPQHIASQWEQILEKA